MKTIIDSILLGIAIALFIFTSILYLHWADKRDEQLMKMYDKCVYVEDTNGVIHCTDN